MECFVPGRVLISPSYSWDDARGSLSGALPMEHDVLYSVEDILRHYGFDSQIDLFRKTFGHLPVMIEVPEGREHEACGAIRKSPAFKAACPDLLVRPSGPVQIDGAAVDEAIKFINAEIASPGCGSGVKIAVLDSGIDQTLLPPHAMLQQQYDSQAPGAGGGLPEDAYGHGSLVGYIINRVAPAAEIVSVKVMDSVGSIGGVIAGLYLAEAAGPCHLINLSLSVSCDGQPCPLCNTNVNGDVSSAQFRYFFSQFWQRLSSGPSPLIVAAAGNGYGHVAMPASFPECLAVGAFDIDAQRASDGSQYEHVPHERYVLAPGGRRSGQVLARVPGRSFALNDALFGSSFATAFVTGVAARWTCGALGGPCGGQPRGTLRDHLGNRIAENSVRNWIGYSQDQHGLGLLWYRP